MTDEDVELIAEVRRDEPGSEVVWWSFRVYRGTRDIGGVDFWACRACHHVLLGEIGLVETEQNTGLGRWVVERLRQNQPGYRWSITAAKRGSQTFWQRLRETYTGEYGTGSCPHIRKLL